jgi:hypothetical protein
MRFDDCEINQQVDVFPYDTDEFYEFTGKIIDIDEDNNLISVRDQDDDVFQVSPRQIRLTYSDETDSLYN